MNGIDGRGLASCLLHVKGVEHSVFVIVIVRAPAEGLTQVVGGVASQPLVVAIAAAELEHSLAPPFN